MSPFWRRSKPLHEQLAAEGGLELDAPRAPEAPEAPEPVDPLAQGTRFMDAETRAILARPRRWDAVVTAEAPGLDGSEILFVTLEDRSIVVEAQEGEGSLDALAQAVETQINAPYRAVAVRHSETTWAVSAKRVRIERFSADGDELELAVRGGQRTLTVDGELTFGTIPELVQLGEAEASDYVVRAERLEGDLWDVEVSPL